MGDGAWKIRPHRRLADDGKRFEAMDVLVRKKKEIGRGFGGGGVENSTGAEAGGFFFFMFVEGFFRVCFS